MRSENIPRFQRVGELIPFSSSGWVNSTIFSGGAPSLRVATHNYKTALSVNVNQTVRQLVQKGEIIPEATLKTFYANFDDVSKAD